MSNQKELYLAVTQMIYDERLLVADRITKSKDVPLFYFVIPSNNFCGANKLIENDMVWITFFRKLYDVHEVYCRLLPR